MLQKWLSIFVLLFTVFTATNAHVQMQAARTLTMADPIRPVEVLYNGRKRENGSRLKRSVLRVHRHANRPNNYSLESGERRIIRI